MAWRSLGPLFCTCTKNSLEKKEVITNYLEGNAQTAIFEVNSEGQLASLLKSETGFVIPNKFLKFDGRPFYYEEVLADVESAIKIHLEAFGGEAFYVEDIIENLWLESQYDDIPQ